MLAAIPEETGGCLSHWSSMRQGSPSSSEPSSTLAARVSGKEVGREGTATSLTVVGLGDKGTSGVCIGDWHEWDNGVE